MTEPDVVDFNERVGANVARYRKAAGMSQAELARRLGALDFSVQQPTVLKIEKGTRPLKFDEAASIADLLGVSVTDLLPVSNLLLERLLDAQAHRAMVENVREQLVSKLALVDRDLEEAKRAEREAQNAFHGADESTKSNSERTRLMTTTGSGDRSELTPGGRGDRSKQTKTAGGDPKYSTTGVEIPAVTPIEAVTNQVMESLAEYEGRYAPPKPEDDPDA